MKCTFSEYSIINILSRKKDERAYPGLADGKNASAITIASGLFDPT
jgi:hypothetical protein